MISNATIEECSIEIEDHGILTGWLHLDYGNGTHQGFGGFCLGSPNSPKSKNLLGSWVLNIFKVTGSSNWDQVKGKNVRVDCNDEFNGFVLGIGHITEDVWFYPKKCWSVK